MSSFVSANRVLVFFVGLWVSLSFGLLVIACGDEPSSASAEVGLGNEALARADLSAADVYYRQAVQQSPDDAQAAFGHALTRLLLLPDSAAVRQLVQVTGGHEVQLEPLLYGSDGALALLAQGKDLDSVLTLLRNGSPWGGARLASLTAFLAGLPNGVAASDLSEPLQALAAELHGIASWFEAGAADEQLCFQLPGAALHLSADVQGTAADARLLGGLLRLGEGLCLGAAGLLGDGQPLELGELAPTELAARLDERLAQDVPSAQLLQSARFALDLGLEGMQEGLALGTRNGLRACPSAAGAVSLIRWDRVSAPEVAALTTLLSAVRQALYTSTVLPDSAPSTSFGLAPCFEAAFWGVLGRCQALAADGSGQLIWRDEFVAQLLDPLAAPSVVSTQGDAATITWPAVFRSGVPSDGFLKSWFAPLLETARHDFPGLGL